MVLREFAYFDRQKIIDFVSALHKGLPQSRRELKVQDRSKFSGQLGLPFAQLGATKGGGKLEIEELKTETDASLFEALYEMLQSSHQVVALSQAKVGDIIEEQASVELSGKDVLADVMGGLMPIMERQSPPGVDLRNLEQTKVLIQNLSSRGVTVIMAPESDPKRRIVSDLHQDRLRATRPELIGNYTGLCRIQRILNPGETVDLFRIVSGLKLPPQAYDGLTAFQHPMWNVNLTKEKFE